MRDYARKSLRQSEQHNNHAWMSPIMLILAVVFLLCALVHFMSETSSPLQTAQPTAQSTSKQNNHVITQPVNDQPKFDFYKLLPKMTVTTPEDSNAPSNSDAIHH